MSDSFKVCDGLTVGDIRKCFLHFTECSDEKTIYETPIVLDTNGVLGDMNAGLSFNTFDTKKDFTIYFRQNNDMSELLIKSLFHELTHLVDYNDFVKKFNAGCFNGKQYQNNYCFYFMIWSEFHAQYMSFHLLYKLFDSNPENDYIDKFFGFENQQIDYMDKEINISNFKKIIRYLGRFHLLSLYDSRFSNCEVMDKKIVNKIEYFINQDFTGAVSLFGTIRDCDRFYSARKQIAALVDRFRNIDIIKDELRRTNIF